MTNTNTPEEPNIDAHLDAYEPGEALDDIRATVQQYTDAWRNRLSDATLAEPDIEPLVAEYEEGEAQNNVRETLESIGTDFRRHYDQVVSANTEAGTSTGHSVADLQVATQTQYSSQENNIGMRRAGLWPGLSIAGIEFLAGSTVASSLLTGGIIGSGLLATYGLGRLEGKIWNRKKAGAFKNMLRGLISPVTLPAAAVVGLYKSGEKAASNTAEAIPKMLTGNSTPVKVVSAPFWWPVRSGYRIVNGAISAAKGESSFSGTKGMGKIGYAVAKPLRIVPWLLQRPSSAH